MPFNVTCVRCNALITTITKDKVRDYTQIHETEICKKCVQKEEEMRSFYEKRKKQYMAKLDSILTEAIEDLDNKIKEIAHGISRAA